MLYKYGVAKTLSLVRVSTVGTVGIVPFLLLATCVYFLGAAQFHYIDIKKSKSFFSFTTNQDNELQRNNNVENTNHPCHILARGHLEAVTSAAAPPCGDTVTSLKGKPEHYIKTEPVVAEMSTNGGQSSLGMQSVLRLHLLSTPNAILFTW